MKKLKNSMAMALVLASSLSMMPSFVSAKNVDANLPGFNVTLNGEKVDNTYSEYPLIVYKDITYFPMTYNTSRFLGVETNWSQGDGLAINQTGIDGKFDFYKINNKNNNSYPVSIQQSKITVNGKNVNNNEEEYPLLIFRDVTYFPMTWRFCVDEFGWEYDFNKDNGLRIKSVNKKKEEPKKEDTKKEEKKEEEWKDYSKTIFYNGNYYVIKEKNNEHRLFKDSHIGNDSTMLTELEIKEFKQLEDKIYFFSGKDPYYYDLKKGKVEKLLTNADVKDGKIITIDGEVFWINEEDGELYNKEKEKVSKGNKVEDISKEDEYLIVNFENTKDNKYKFIVYDKDGKEIYKSKNNAKDVKIDGNKLSFYNLDKNKTEEVKLKNK